MRQFWICASVGVMLAVLVAPARSDTATEALYKTKCAACHGPDGKGDTAAGKKMGAHDFASPAVQKQTGAELSKAIAKGRNKMPGYEKSLKVEQIEDLVAYIRELAKKK